MTAALLAGIVAFAATQRMASTYEASASLLASQPPSSFGNVDLIRPPAVDPRVYQRVLLDSTLIHDALMRFDGVDRSDSAMKAFMRRVRVSVENQDVSSIVHISVRDSQPARAAAYANAFADALIDWDRSRARDVVQNSIAAIERSIEDIDREIAAAVASGDADDAQKLQAAGATLREQRVRELDSARARSASAVVVGLLEHLSVARPPAEAIGPRLVFNVFVALVLGLLLGYGVQLARWSFTNSVNDREDLSEATATRVLAVFPRRRRGSHRLASDAVSFFRANLLSVVGKPRPFVVGVTSPTSYAEKIGVAGSLAEALSRSGLRTLLIDADLRQEGPGFGIELGRTQTPSLDEYLQDPGARVQPVTVVSESRVSFDVLPSRVPTRQPSELITYGFDRLLTGLKANYDAIIVDLAPALLHADAVIAATSCTGLVIAVGRGSNGRRAAEAAQLLEANRATLLGTVLTGTAGPSSRTRASTVKPGRKVYPTPVPEAEVRRTQARVKPR